jgi:hypothetical protein
VAEVHLSLIDQADLIPALQDAYFLIDDLFNKHKAARRSTDEQILSDVAPLILSSPIADWDPALHSNFLGMACRLARSEVLALPVGDDGLDKPCQLADVLCGMVMAGGERVETRIRRQVVALWVMTRLATGAGSDGLESFAASAVDALQGLGLSFEDLRDQVRAQCVLYVARLSPDTDWGGIPDDVALAREWCAGLLGKEGFDSLLSKPARLLDVSLPEPVISEDKIDKAEVPSPLPIPVPNFFRLPEALSEERQQQEFRTCLLLLKALARRPNGPLSTMTANQIGELSTQFDVSRFGLPFNYAAQNLWKVFWTEGDVSHLDLTARIAQLLSAVRPDTQQPSQSAMEELVGAESADQGLEAAVGCIVAILEEQPDGKLLQAAIGQRFLSRCNATARAWAEGKKLGEVLQLAAQTGLIAYEGEHPQQYAYIPGYRHAGERSGGEPSFTDREARDWRASGLHIWMNTQLPELIHTCSIPAILEDAAKCTARLGIILFGHRIRQGIVEAFAGECRRLEQEGKASQRQSLLLDNEGGLRAIHAAFESSRVSQAARDDERAAWTYLFPTPVPEPNRSSEQEQSVSQADTIASNPNYLAVIKSGDRTAFREFVQANLEDIKDLLLMRLDARLSIDRLWLPEESVTIRNGNRNETHPLFTESMQAISNGSWKEAIKKLERLERDVRYQAVGICQSLRAYALAKDGEKIEAALLLTRLTDSGFKFPSAYWNQACCIANQQSERDVLDVLARGLETAPHPLLLRGAVARALLIDDPRLTQWLNRLTFSEALVLSIYYESDSLTWLQWAELLVLLKKYATSGEPPILDPTDRSRRISFYDIRDHILTDLRYQPEAAEFWLLCRHRIASNNFDYWQVRSEFLEARQRIPEAAEACEQEVRCRLSLLERASHLRANTPAIIRRRAQEWLRRCSQSPDLLPVGQRIYNRLKQSRQRAELLPNDRTITQTYDPSRDDVDDNPAAPQGRPQGRFIDVLNRTGVACMSRLHQPKHVSSVRAELGETLDALRGEGRSETVAALEQLIQAWDKYPDTQDTTTSEERQHLLGAAQNAYAKLQGSMAIELTPEERGAATQFMTALHRVNDKLAGALMLLPRITASAPDGEVVVVPDSTLPTAFAVRLSSSQGSSPVELLEATATLVEEADVVEFALRDRLDEIAMIISPECSAILSFEVPSSIQLPESARVRVQVWYKYSGAQYRAICDPIPIERHVIPSLPDSPYIHARAIEPEEIDNHFFGRENEQQQILAALSGGQQKLLYIEGIRRTGKSTLFNSIRKQISDTQLPLVPVRFDVSGVSREKTAGQVLCGWFRRIVLEPEVAAAGVTAPDEDQCDDDMEIAYLLFSRQLTEKLPDRRVLVFLDEFQGLVETSRNAIKSQTPLGAGIQTLLSILRNSTGPNARLLWLFAGYRPKRDFLNMLPGYQLWAQLQSLPIDFLSSDAIREILTVPLTDTNVVIPPETSSRVYALTAGHPEVVQEMGETMLSGARAEGRWILTPADADEAARAVQYNDDKFADTWFPLAELSKEQRGIVAAFINAVARPGGRIEPSRLFNQQQMNDDQRNAVADLAARKIFDTDGETVGIKAHVLDLWIRRNLPRIILDDLSGSVAVFVDVPNVTGGSAEPVVTDLATRWSDSGLPGRFKLETVLDVIERYASNLSSAPIDVRWAANYPPHSPALSICHDKEYLLAKVPENFHRKGNDDIVLIEKMMSVEHDRPYVNHFVVVTGDKDYRIRIESLLAVGKSVHVVAREQSLADIYRSMAQEHSKRFSFATLEELIEEYFVK